VLDLPVFIGRRKTLCTTSGQNSCSMFTGTVSAICSVLFVSVYRATSYLPGSHRVEMAVDA